MARCEACGARTGSVVKICPQCGAVMPGHEGKGITVRGRWLSCLAMVVAVFGCVLLAIFFPALPKSMTNPQHLPVSYWLGRRDFRGADLYDANLRKVNLTGGDLTAADLREADLSESSLYFADLSGADLRDANLSNTYLAHANLTGATVTDTQLEEARGLYFIVKPNGETYTEYYPPR